MSMFRAKKLDLGCHITARIIRDHTKRKVFAEYEVERYEHDMSKCTSSHGYVAYPAFKMIPMKRCRRH